MYLSCLEIDTSTVRGRTWLANPYRIHQRLLMAFPDGEAGRVLFRIEDDREPPRIIVQSAIEPNWRKAFRDHPILAATPQCKQVGLQLRPGQRLRFVLRANPTKRVPAKAAGRGTPQRDSTGPRVGLYKEEDQLAWLARKGEDAGFQPLDCAIRSAIDLKLRKSADGRSPSMTFHAVDFEGRLTVVEPDRFVDALEGGIGAAKGIGFGLMLVARG